MPIRARVNWKGEAIKRKSDNAVKGAIDDTMAACVIDAKRNHPGWKNRTTNAEGSISIVKEAHREGKRTSGRWGSTAVDYMIWLELKHGSALRSAADVQYPSLDDRLEQWFNRTSGL